MTPLDELLLFSGLTLALTLLLGRFSYAGKVATVFYAGQLLFLVKMADRIVDGSIVTFSLQVELFGQQMSWRFDALSWFFAVITLGAGLLSSWYASGEWGERFRQRGGNLWLLHVALAANVFSMLILLASGDLLALFIGWELVSWASFLLMAVAGGRAIQAAMRYITYAMSGAMAILAGIVLLWSHAGGLQYGQIIDVIPQLSQPQVWLLVGLFGSGFAVKMGLLPFHLWQAAAYAETPGPGAAFFGAISARMGLYAFILVLVQLIGLARLSELTIPFTFLDMRDLWAWIAVLTIILPTYIALRQNDARYLLAWHGIGQGGYMLLGLVMGDALGSAGGLLHVFNYATNQAVLFFAVFAVMFRTGTADLNKLGGLITRMPISFFAMLVGIIGLAGLPPMNGFVSKWFVYRSLMIEGEPLLFLGAIIGTLGTILSVYKLIHNTFLGQLRVEHVEVREAPWSMVAPMIILMLLIFATGVAPGLVLDWVALVQSAVGLPVVENTLGGVELASGSLDMLWVVGVLFAGFGVGALLFYSGGRTRQVHQLDNYAGGHFLTAETRYHYSDNFYAGLMHLIRPWYRESFVWLESTLGSLLGIAASLMQRLYGALHPSIYLLVTVVVTLTWVLL
ncbi:proton-conducting transporter transmembrane domain-containing protein [endosymbiont of Lamellibrachia barhami]|uniref:proton-conducting transporter transmembrane domain-containing protein n=1 Tax=endosymbiont of Lamellibrachia barhami TaxID=205975 RepID=UPI0015A8AFBE